MKVWESREAWWEIDHRIMTRRLWLEYRHEVRLNRRRLDLLLESFGEVGRVSLLPAMGRVVADLNELAAKLAPMIAQIVAAFEGDETYQRWRLVSTLAEIRDRRE